MSSINGIETKTQGEFLDIALAEFAKDVTLDIVRGKVEGKKFWVMFIAKDDKFMEVNVQGKHRWFNVKTWEEIL